MENGTAFDETSLLTDEGFARAIEILEQIAEDRGLVNCTSSPRSSAICSRISIARDKPSSVSTYVSSKAGPLSKLTFAIHLRG